jgi:hypothetical protein
MITSRQRILRCWKFTELRYNCTRKMHPHHCAGQGNSAVNLLTNIWEANVRILAGDQLTPRDGIMVSHSSYRRIFVFVCICSLFYNTVSFFFLMGWHWVHLVLRPLFGLLYQPRMIDDEFGAVGGMRIGWGDRSTRRKPAPVPLRPPQIPHDLTRARSRAAAVMSQKLAAWAMAWPHCQ